jgi:hypothetical protein
MTLALRTMSSENWPVRCGRRDDDTPRLSLPVIFLGAYASRDCSRPWFRGGAGRNLSRFVAIQITCRTPPRVPFARTLTS